MTYLILLVQITFIQFPESSWCSRDSRITTY